MDLDQRLAAFLREGAPPRSDPLFRVRVLQRLERRRFRRRLYTLGVAACGAVVMAGLGAGAEGAPRAGVVLFAAVAAISCLVHAPVVTYFWRRLTRHSGVRDAS